MKTNQLTDHLPELGAHGGVYAADTAAYTGAIADLTDGYRYHDLPEGWVLTTTEGEPVAGPVLSQMGRDAIRARLSPRAMVQRAESIQAGLIALESRKPVGRGKNRRAERRMPKAWTVAITAEAWEELRHELRTGERIFADQPRGDE